MGIVESSMRQEDKNNMPESSIPPMSKENIGEGEPQSLLVFVKAPPKYQREPIL